MAEIKILVLKMAEIKILVLEMAEIILVLEMAQSNNSQLPFHIHCQLITLLLYTHSSVFIIDRYAICIAVYWDGCSSYKTLSSTLGQTSKLFSYTLDPTSTCQALVIRDQQATTAQKTKMLCTLTFDISKKRGTKLSILTLDVDCFVTFS